MTGQSAEPPPGRGGAAKPHHPDPLDDLDSHNHIGQLLTESKQLEQANASVILKHQPIIDQLDDRIRCGTQVFNRSKQFVQLNHKPLQNRDGGGTAAPDLSFPGSDGGLSRTQQNWYANFVAYPPSLTSRHRAPRESGNQGGWYFFNSFALALCSCSGGRGGEQRRRPPTPRRSRGEAAPRQLPGGDRGEGGKPGPSLARRESSSGGA